MQIGPINTTQIARNLTQGANAAAQAAQQAAANAAKQAAAAAEAAANAAAAAAANAAAAAESAAGQVESAVQEGAAAAGQTAATVANTVASGAAAAAGVATGFLSSVGAAIGGFAKGAFELASGIGRAVIEGVADLAKGVVAFAGALGGVAMAIGNRIASGIGDLFFKQTPELSELAVRAREANQGEAQPRRLHDTDAEAREFWELSFAMYDDSAGLPAGWEEVPNAEQELGVSLIDPETGLEARVFKKTGADGRDVYVLAFEGTTSGDQGIDWDQNLANGVGAVPPQFRQALDIGLRFKEVYGDRGDLVVTGHSLGGGLATFAGVGAGIETYTYNPSGLGPSSRLFLDSLGLVNRNQHLVKNYVQNGEILADLRGAQNVLMPWTMLYGGSLQLIGEVEHFGDFLLLDPIGAHNDPQMDRI